MTQPRRPDDGGGRSSPHERVTVVVASGVDCEDLGQVLVRQLGGTGAIAMSRGRLPKRPAPLDRNEDAALLASGPAGVLAAVVDGHHGRDSAEGVLRAVEARAASLLARRPAEPVAALNDLLADAQARTAQQLATLEGARSRSRAAVTVALGLRHAVFVATIGDTAAWLVRRGRGRRHVTFEGDRRFLGPEPMTAPVRRARWSARDRLVLASDGLVNFVPRAYVAAVVRGPGAMPMPTEIARSLVDAALLGGAGDNVTVIAVDLAAGVHP